MSDFKKTDRTSVSRYRWAASFDKDLVYSILDEALFCDIAFVVEGQPYLIPTGFARDGDFLYVHGSVGSHFLRTVKSGVPVCISVTLLDGIVVARKAFDHNVNYRSVVMFSVPEEVTDPAEQLAALRTFTEKMIPGSWDYTVPVVPKEQQKTTVLKFKIEECSAKTRTGDPKIGQGEEVLNIWSGVIPLQTRRLPGIPDAPSRNLPIPAHISGSKTLNDQNTTT